jgi:hypothetical protein
MEQMSKEFLAGARFANDQHGTFHFGSAFDMASNFADSIGSTKKPPCSLIRIRAEYTRRGRLR